MNTGHRQETPTGGTPAGPVVSVVMPTYNKAPHLREAIDSVLGQTFEDWELIVVDDGSTDNTAALLSEYRDPRIKVHTLAANVGRSRARNVAIGVASGRYIAICDSDDVSAPTRFAQQVAFLDRHPDIGVVSGFMVVLSRTATTHVTYGTEPSAIARRFAAGRMGVAHGASMVRAVCFERLGLYCEDLRSAEDFELFRRFSRHYRFAVIPEVLLQYRNEIRAWSMRGFLEQSRAHRYAIYRSEPIPAGARVLAAEEFARRWRTTFSILTLDLLRHAHFSLRTYVFSRYAIR